jgi:hypothetical protein
MPPTLYVGKAEDSLASRDLKTHFGDGRTGQSTVRRSFAALLHDTLGLPGFPRNIDTPAYFSNYGLSASDDATLTTWMREHLRLAVWPKPSNCEFTLGQGRNSTPRRACTAVEPTRRRHSLDGAAQGGTGRYGRGGAAVDAGRAGRGPIEGVTAAFGAPWMRRGVCGR